MKTLTVGTLSNGRPFTLPADLGDCKIAVLAQSKAGKTYGLGDILEELVKAQRPFIAVDPANNLWGLRSRPDGSPSGLPVVVIGGPHGDVPLEKDAGERVAEALLAEPICAVIDVAFESKTTTRHFIANLCNRLMRTRSTVSRVFVAEEAPEFVPQRASYQGIQVCKAAVEQILRVGGNFGYGAIVASQRSATIDKDVLSQCEALIVMRLTGAADRKAIKDWIESKNIGDQVERCFDTLASLKDGEAWLWWPTQDRFERFTFRKRETLHPREMKKLGLNPSEVQLGDSKAFVARLKEELSRKQVTTSLQKEVARRLPSLARTPLTVDRVDAMKIAEGVGAALEGGQQAIQEARDLAAQSALELGQVKAELREERRRREDAERRLAAVRAKLKPEYEALRELFEDLGSTSAAGAVDRSAYAVWLEKAPRQSHRKALEFLLEKGHASRHQISTVAGIDPTSTYYKVRQWLTRNGLAEEHADGLKLRAL